MNLGGNIASHEDDNWRIPKRDLVGVLQALLQSRRLKVSSKLELGRSETGDFILKAKIDPANSYSAWRVEEHDDLILNMALATRYAEYMASKEINFVPVDAHSLHVSARLWIWIALLILKIKIKRGQ